MIPLTLKGRKFAIVGPQRTGSTMLVRALNSLPNYQVHDEVFVAHGMHQESYTFRDWFIKVFEKRLNKIKKDASSGEFHDFLKNFTPGNLFYRFLDELYGPAKDGVIVGFKVMYNQLDIFPAISDYITSNGIFRIHLLRKNPIKRAVSGYLKDERLNRGLTREHLDKNPRKDIKVKINPETLWNSVLQTEKQYAHHSKIFKHKAGRRYIELFYEDIIDPTNDSLMSITGSATIQEFLNIEESKKIIPIRISIRKQSPVDLRDCIENYVECINYFMLDEKRKEYVGWFEEMD